MAGVYNSTSTITIHGPSALTLDGNGNADSVFIFQAAPGAPGDMTVDNGTTVNYINGAQPCNVFWKVHSAFLSNSGFSFVGTILARDGDHADRQHHRAGKSLGSRYGRHVHPRRRHQARRRAGSQASLDAAEQQRRTRRRAAGTAAANAAADAARAQAAAVALAATQAAAVAKAAADVAAKAAADAKAAAAVAAKAAAVKNAKAAKAAAAKAVAAAKVAARARAKAIALSKQHTSRGRRVAT